jgi:hypothetical protein
MPRSSYDAAVRVMCVDEDGEIVALEDTPVPRPTIEVSPLSPSLTPSSLLSGAFL